MAPGFPTPASPSFPDSLLYDLLDVSLTGVNVLRPVYDPAGEIEDFAIEYLNPAGQRMTGLAERPGGTLLTRFPESIVAGILTYYRRAYAEGYPGLHEVNYQADGLDNYYRLAARRSSELLVVSFTDTADQDRSAVELALRESQAAEQAARADANAQRQRLHEFMNAAPGIVLSLVGPQHVIEFANEGFRQQFGVPDPVGKPYLEALPVAATQDDSAYQATALYDHTYRTGEPYYAAEAPYYIDPTQSGRRELRYFTFAVQAARDGRGRIVGVQAFATDVTAQVLARQQVEQLNQELEARVQARTRELAQAQAETDAQRLRLHQLVAEAPALIASLRGPEHVVELANDGFRAIFGGRELVGKPYREAVPELDGQPFFGLLDEVYRTGETYYGVDEPVVLDRTNSGQLEHTYFTYTYQATRSAQGRIDGILIFAYEVTEQVLARQEREAQRERLQAVFALAPVAVCVFQGEDAVLDVVNPSMAEMLGHPLTSLVGRPFFEALPELRAQGVPELLAGVRRTGTPYVAQEQAIQLARHPAGEPGYYDFVYQPLLDAQRHVTGIACVATDVSAQVRARRLVEQREESFRLMADHAPAMLWVTDPAGYCTYLNAQWYAYTGQTEAEALGLGWTQVVHPDDADAAGTAFLDANDRRVPFEFLYRLRRRDGKYRWAIDRGLPRFGPDGAFEGIVGTVVDVHEQKLAELALQKLTKKLRKSRDQAEALNAELGTTNQQLLRTNVDLDNFVYTASHDLRAPIANLEALVSALRLELPAPGSEVAFLVNLMQDSIQRFSHTLELLTDVSKLQHAYSEGPVAVALAPLIEDVRLDLAPLLAQVGGQLHVDVAAVPTLTFSEKNLRSVVYNLVSNAFKYHDPARPADVTVRTREQGPYVVLEVQDNGLGLDLESEHQLFGLFRRYHTHVEGSGVGLHMVKKLVENAGGKVEVTSRLGQGSTFTVYFPH